MEDYMQISNNIRVCSIVLSFTNFGLMLPNNKNFF